MTQVGFEARRKTDWSQAALSSAISDVIPKAAAAPAVFQTTPNKIPAGIDANPEIM
jgi:hypothetical protein